MRVLQPLSSRLTAFLADEDGQAMTSSASFMCCCALIVASAYYYGGDRLQGFVDMIMNSPPPGTSDSLFH